VFAHVTATGLAGLSVTGAVHANLVSIGALIPESAMVEGLERMRKSLHR
jgi:hypothetical protein